MIISVLFYILVVVTAIQITYYLCFSQLAFHKESRNDHMPPVSVLICAKNEAENLSEFVPSIIRQEYPNFEIVLINDTSSDETLQVMEDFKKDNKNIKIVDVKRTEAFIGNKKYALTLGIKAATHEHLLFTDADCRPVGNRWITEMASRFSEEKTIVIGYGKYQRKKYSLLNLLIRYETLLTAIQYFSYAKSGSPYMAVGRNLAYKKSTFFKVKGFIKHLNIRSGDDDLFIQDAATNSNTIICTDKDSFTISRAPDTFKKWFRQKRRHVSASSYYKFKHKFLLGLFYITKVFFYLLTILLFFFYSWEIIAAFAFVYFITQYIIIGASSKKLEEPQLLYFLPFLDLFLILFQFAIFIANSFSKPKYWN